jgi:hypothetical protein
MSGALWLEAVKLVSIGRSGLGLDSLGDDGMSANLGCVDHLAAKM